MSGYVLAVVSLVAALILVLLFWRHGYEREMRAAEQAFVDETTEVVGLVQQRLVNYELTTRGAVALFATVDRPTPAQWRAYVDGFQLQQRFPAIRGIGYAAYVDSQGLEALQLDMREAGLGLLRVRPHGIREYYAPVIYLEPATGGNRRAIGNDLYVQPARREAMIAARDHGGPHLSGRTRLSQGPAGQEPDIAMYAPVYRTGNLPADVDVRRLSMRGWVYLALDLPRFIERALAPMNRDVRLRLYDTTGGSETLLYADAGEDAPGVFHHSVQVDLYGRQWRYDFQSGPLADAVPALADLRITVAIALLAALLLFMVAWALARTEAHAERMASRMAESFRRSETRFRTAMHYSAIGKVLLDAGGRVIEVNPAFASILQREPKSLVGAMFNALLVVDEIPAGRSGADHDGEIPLAGGVRRSTRRLRRRDGDLRELQLTRAPVPGDIGQDIAQLVQVEDITDRVRAEHRVLALNRSLESRVALRTRELTNANRELESFSYSVSHDLRAPLRSIDGFSRLLSDRYAAQLDDNGRDYLLRIRNAAARMDDLIQSLLQMSRLSRGKLAPEVVDLSQLAADIVHELRSSEPDRQVQVDIAPDLQANGDPVLVRSVLQNLMANAWKFTRDRIDARIEVGSTGTGHDKAFFVRDNGAGFDPEFGNRLFRPFQRLHDGERFPGHGIGLASAKRIIERHGGEIRAEGRPGEGATFCFTLPVAPEDE